MSREFNTFYFWSQILIITVFIFFLFLLSNFQYSYSVDASSITPILSNSGFVDVFEISEIYSTSDSGREWFAKWDNGKVRSLNVSNHHDPFDPYFHLEGEGAIEIDGNGTAIMSGKAPRMYVYDETEQKKWNNVEITFYAQRINETETIDWSGIVASGPTDHHNATLDPCLGQAYYGRMLFNGYIDFEKEVKHQADQGYINSNRTMLWESGIPKEVWIGYKLVHRIVDEKYVKLELYIDLTDGLNGGAWNKLIEYSDKGGWGTQGVQCPGQTFDAIFIEPRTSIMIRADEVSEIKYKKFSIREIDPLN